jgi:hypothetical protein
LIKPKLAEGVQFDTERVVKMAGQGAVYVRSLFPMMEEDEDNEELYNCSLQIRYILLSISLNLYIGYLKKLLKLCFSTDYPKISKKFYLAFNIL